MTKKDSVNAQYSYQLGLSYAYAKERDRMINCFLDTYKKDTGHVRAISKLALSFFKLNKLDSTYLFINKGLALAPSDVSINRIKVNQLFREKKYAETIPVLLKLDSIEKMDLFNNTMLGKAYYNLEDFANAKLRFEKAVKLDRDAYKNYTYLGNIAMQQKKFKSAMFNYYQASSKGNEKRDAEYYGLANAYYAMKRPKMALKFYKKACEENFKNYQAKFQVAKITDALYEDKKMAYAQYKKYEKQFLDRDKVMTDFVQKRISDIKKEYFMKGEFLE